jgi:hypothetical protein
VGVKQPFFPGQVAVLPIQHTADRPVTADSVTIIQVTLAGSQSCVVKKDGGGGGSGGGGDGDDDDDDDDDNDDDDDDYDDDDHDEEEECE